MMSVVQEQKAYDLWVRACEIRERFHADSVGHSRLSRSEEKHELVIQALHAAPWMFVVKRCRKDKRMSVVRLRHYPSDNRATHVPTWKLP